MFFVFLVYSRTFVSDMAAAVFLTGDHDFWVLVKSSLPPLPLPFYVDWGRGYDIKVQHSLRGQP